MDAYVGEIRLFSFDFAPRNWLACDGQTLPIQGNTALFSIIGTVYGGDGRTTFKLPDLRGRTPVHSGNGAAGAPALGQTGGQEKIGLTVDQLPDHGHRLLCATGAASATTPTGNILAAPASSNMYSNTITPTPIASAASGGAGLPYDSRQPFQTVQYCICINGLFPPKP